FCSARCCSFCSSSDVIGRMIVERQRDAEDGTVIAANLSKDLRREFPGVMSSIMREFYLLYCNDKRMQPLVARSGWTHNPVIFQHPTFGE
ncbi:MAG TPA: DUF1016 N-terminal domain-containing protein, partial [Synergistaceae bacterium]|nr:DUF1016 N-terminal domain-containing protein [Synergistaceae bacterium]